MTITQHKYDLTSNRKGKGTKHCKYLEEIKDTKCNNKNYKKIKRTIGIKTIDNMDEISIN